MTFKLMKLFSCLQLERMECGQREALVQRHEKEGFEVDFDARKKYAL